MSEPHWIAEGQRLKDQLWDARNHLRSTATSVAQIVFNHADNGPLRLGLTEADVVDMANATKCFEAVWERLKKWVDDERLKHIRGEDGYR